MNSKQDFAFALFLAVVFGDITQADVIALQQSRMQIPGVFFPDLFMWELLLAKPSQQDLSFTSSVSLLYAVQ